MIELACRRAISATGHTRTLALVVVLSVLWMVFGTISLFDPYPFQFLGVVCNVLQLWMIFVLAVGQRGAERQHDHVINAVAEHAAATRVHIKRHLDDALEIHRRDVRDHVAEVGASVINQLAPEAKKPARRAPKAATRTRR